MIKHVFRIGVATYCDSKVREDVASKTHFCKQLAKECFWLEKWCTNHLNLYTTKRWTQWCEKGILQVGKWKVKPPYHLHQDDILGMEFKIPMKCDPKWVC